MPKDKLRRFAEFREFPHTFDFPYEMKGKWKSDFFKNNHPLVLELGCGKGEYTVSLARHYPQKNFIGMDIKSNRMWKGAGTSYEEQLPNVAFIRAVIGKITELFAPAEADEIWITFPDPFPKDRHAKHRLTAPGFLAFYKQVLIPGGTIHLKTDDDGLFSYTLETLQEQGISPNDVNWDVHGNADSHPHLRGIRTYYEDKFTAKGRTVKYLNFRFDE